MTYVKGRMATTKFIYLFKKKKRKQTIQNRAPYVLYFENFILSFQETTLNIAI